MKWMLAAILLGVAVLLSGCATHHVHHRAHGPKKIVVKKHPHHHGHRHWR